MARDNLPSLNRNASGQPKNVIEESVEMTDEEDKKVPNQHIVVDLTGEGENQEPQANEGGVDGQGDVNMNDGNQESEDELDEE